MIKLPLAIEIQTIADCNSKCIICPNYDLKYHGLMTDMLFVKIIDEIAEWNTDVLVILYLNGEPFLDSSIIERIRYVNKKCSKAKIELSTNLSLVNNKVLKKMKEVHINDLRISFFGFSKNTYQRMMPGLHWEQSYENLEYLMKFSYRKNIFDEISIVMIKHPYVPDEEYHQMKNFCDKHNIKLNIWGFLDRCGNVSGFSNDIYIASGERVTGCEQNRPFERLHIYYDGDIVLCCQDWMKSYILGNATINSLKDIWNGEKYQSARIKTYNTLSENLPDICRHCKLMGVR
jgi:radical SAM protein with 4Fe4S-binding SPASM domain